MDTDGVAGEMVAGEPVTDLVGALEKSLADAKAKSAATVTSAGLADAAAAGLGLGNTDASTGPCPECDGNGYTDDSCPDCDGAGCEECGDSGEVELPCDACDSTGVVVVNEGDVK